MLSSDHLIQIQIRFKYKFGWSVLGQDAAPLIVPGGAWQQPTIGVLECKCMGE